MPTIIPSADLRNHYTEIEELAKKTGEPIYLTKNGRGSLVLMDIDAFESYQLDTAWRRYAQQALAEAERHEREGATYTEIESAFEELLSEDLGSSDGDASENAHATA